MMTMHTFHKTEFFGSVAVFFLLMFCIHASASSTPQFNNPVTPSIVGGSVSPQGQIPWMTYISKDDNSVLCGGSLVDQRWILSAAHCFAAGDITEYTW